MSDQSFRQHDLAELVERARRGVPEAPQELAARLRPLIAERLDPEGRSAASAQLAALADEAAQAVQQAWPGGEPSADRRVWLEAVLDEILRSHGLDPRRTQTRRQDLTAPYQPVAPPDEPRRAGGQEAGPETPPAASNDRAAERGRGAGAAEAADQATLPADAPEAVNAGAPAGGAGAESETLAGQPAPRPFSPAPGRRFGDYELLGVIAKGGMGVVYKARQRRLNRVVALKMILAGQLADQRDIERFYAEAQAAANLRHPNIVSVHEVGEAEGQHYFSMDYVEGQSLAEVVRERPLPPRRAAELVRKVAVAVQYAHERGILHRDLKPSNVLLDERGEPMITDFGVAKRVGGDSHLTLTGTVVGTPSYMPPEQAAGRARQVGPESDVYATGAMLYELLTGAPPFRAATPLETLRQVLHNEPAPLRVLNPNIPADLETICLKCLQKEPHRRYRSERELAEELGRFLAGEPILARPVTRLERLARWARRNPVVAALSAALAASLLLAALVFVRSYFQVRSALRQAEQSLQQALRSVDELFTLVSENRLLNEPGAQSLRKELLLRARDLYQEILAQQGDNPAVRDELALSYYRLGRILEDVDASREALEAYEAAVAMQEALAAERPDDPERLDHLGDTYNALAVTLQRLGRSPEALRRRRQAQQVRDRLVQLRPDCAAYRRKQANSRMNLGLLHQMRGELDEAEQFLEQAQSLRLAMLEGAANADEADQLKLARRDLAMGYYNLALAAQRRAEEAAAEGDDQSAAARRRRAAEQLEQAVAAFQTVLDENPESLEDQFRMAVCLHALGQTRPEDGAQRLQDAIGLLEPLANQNPDVDKYVAELAATYVDLAGMLVEDQQAGARRAKLYQDAVALLGPLTDKRPDRADYRLNLALALRALGIEQLLAGEGEEATKHLRAAVEQLELLVAQRPEQPAYVEERERTRRLLAQLLGRPGA